jgi:hypothetical protein
MLRWAGHVSRIGEKRNMYRLLVGKPEGKRPLGRLRRRWIDNTQMDLLEIGLNVVELNKHKSAGNEQIPAERVQTEGEILMSLIQKFVNSIWSKEELLVQWK